MDFWWLDDYVKHTHYHEDNRNKTCVEEALAGSIPDPWAWLANATLIEKRVIRNRVVDVWGAKFPNGDEIGVACFEEDLTRPLVIIQRNAQRDELAHELEIWRTVVPNPDAFNPLPNCA